MDAFEQVVAHVLRAKGMWVTTSLKIDLSKKDKRQIDNPSMPRPELDIAAYCARTNSLFAIECKSFLDSTGVNFDELCGGGSDSTYKLFRRPNLRSMVLTRFSEQMYRRGQCAPHPKVKLGLVAGKVKGSDEAAIRSHFNSKGWYFRGPRWIASQVRRLASTGYENEIMTVTTKLLMRN